MSQPAVKTLINIKKFQFEIESEENKSEILIAEVITGALFKQYKILMINLILAM